MHRTPQLKEKSFPNANPNACATLVGAEPVEGWDLKCEPQLSQGRLTHCFLNFSTIIGVEHDESRSPYFSMLENMCKKI